MRKLLLLPLFFGLVSPAIAHNEANGGDAMHRSGFGDAEETDGAGTGEGWDHGLLPGPNTLQ